ncbi:MAG: hypothetical protein WBC71_01200 [Salaquimonas sp.]
MSALPFNSQNTKSGVAPSLILVMGPQASAFASALVRLDGNTEIYHAETAAEAIDLLSNNKFDHVLVDNRTDGTLTLTIPRLAQLDSVKCVTVLAGPKSAESISAIPGIGHVITPPYNPIEIANALQIEVKDSRKQSVDDNGLARRADDQDITNQPEAPAQGSTENELEPDEDYTKAGEAPALVKFLSTAVNFIPGFTPLLSMLYKNLALTILAALFAAFVSYGIMIAYFLTSGDWSSPLQLQPGHELVVKAERELGELKVKRNLASQQLSEAQEKTKRAEESLLRANMLAEITTGIINQEVENRTTRFAELENEVEMLKSVLDGFGSSKDRLRDRSGLKRDYDRRVINRQAYQSSMMNFAQMERQVADIQSELTAKQNDIAMSDQAVSYLNSLKDQMDGKETIMSGTGQTAFVPLTNQIIEVRQMRSSANSDLTSTSQSIPALTDSLDLLTKSIAALESTPMFRALQKPVNVLFVPYDNIDAYQPDQPLYACAFAIFWCSNVGATGNPISGEISTTHPFFGKPLRGQFVEANLTDNSAAKKEILHVGRPPFFF